MGDDLVAIARQVRSTIKENFIDAEWPGCGWEIRCLHLSLFGTISTPRVPQYRNDFRYHGRCADGSVDITSGYR